MTMARSRLIDLSTSGFYHLISRCVRRAFLLDDHEGSGGSRKLAILDRLKFLEESFSIDIGGYCFMDNHFHLVIRTDPAAARTWSAREVVERWFRLCPDSLRVWAKQRLGRKPENDEEVVETVAANEQRVAEFRSRLADPSWLMKLLKERLALAFNREDGCRGHFWEGRFDSISIVGECAILATLIYVDLNVIRAAKALTPEKSDFTSAQERIQHRATLRGSPPPAASGQQAMPVTLTTDRAAEADLWLAPIDATAHENGWLEMTLDTYLEALDAMGRVVRAGKRGAIPADLPPILARLEMDAKTVARMTDPTQELHGTISAGPAARVAEAVRRGARWVVGALCVADDG